MAIQEPLRKDTTSNRIAMIPAEGEPVYDTTLKLMFVGDGVTAGGLVVGDSAGSEKLWPTATPPDGWLEEDGSAISRTTYALLFAVIGTTYGIGDGSTTFNLPDARGEFVRVWDHGAGNDPDAASRTDRGDGTTGDNVGSKQLDDYESHSHSVDGVINGNLGSTTDFVRNGGAGTQSDLNTSIAPSTGGNETRSRNTYRMLIIKY